MCKTPQLFHCCFHKYDLLSQNSLLDYLQDVELVGGDVVAIATHCHFDHSGGLHNFSEVIYRDLSYMFIGYIVSPSSISVVQVWVHKKESKSVREGRSKKKTKLSLNFSVFGTISFFKRFLMKSNVLFQFLHLFRQPASLSFLALRRGGDIFSSFIFIFLFISFLGGRPIFASIHFHIHYILGGAETKTRLECLRV